ncbi:MAG: Ppx/GppA phosphatase family protein [Balneolaceae bacterium]|nr:Ppx/GppA phosphatase family protein [Balneolaceae bacterium]
MYAAIDIGSNTVLLLVARPSSTGAPLLETLHEEQRMPRLGRGVDRSGNLGGEPVARTLEALADYRYLLKEEYPDLREVAVTATSAVRDAGNREEFLSRVRRETGFEVRLLSGPGEAALTYAGATAVLVGEEGTRTTVVDIGGGSTEIARGTRRLRDRWSLDMGCVRYTERFLSGDPPSPGQAEACREAARDYLRRELPEGPFGGRLVGVAGTVTSLGMLDAGLEVYDPYRLNGRRVSLEETAAWSRLLLEMSADERAQRWPGFLAGRADILPAGLLILEACMEVLGFDAVTVSCGGLRHGAVREMAGI